MLAISITKYDAIDIVTVIILSYLNYLSNSI